MKRVSKTFSVDNIDFFKKQLFQWGSQFREVVFLDSNQNAQNYTSFDFLLAVDAFTVLQTDFQGAFDALKQYQCSMNDWLFGYLSYDLKNDTEILTSENHDGLGFHDLFFFQPKKVFIVKNNEITYHYLAMCDDEFESDWIEIDNQKVVENNSKSVGIIPEARLTKSEYVAKVNEMLAHIQRGDIYEANFCMEFFTENAVIEPTEVFHALNDISSPPFATFFKNTNHFLMCASPERYIKKTGTKLISQPIKGTSKRFEKAALDAKSKSDLEQSPKERAENIMIVDLVRNDLSKTAQPGSVQVEELCAVYGFKQVFQKISTIVSELRPEFSEVDALQTTFPMGSMTGAPKISAMQIIEQLEVSKRGLYSGSVGYFTPSGDFDFNVVIRSILYNANNQYLSFSVGSAITNQSEPEAEYDECLLKAKAMFQVLA
uniref:anthranilate synthase component I family protein n=1 Tax=Flavobacterium sp. TaxID=239 RepID=UPI00404B9FB5